MYKSNIFRVAGSPLCDKPVPMDWGDLDLGAKATRLVVLGWARDMGAARSMLGKHAAAVAKGRKERSAGIEQHNRRYKGAGI